MRQFAQGSANDAVARQFGIAFGRHMLASMATMVLPSFVLSLIFYCCLYGFPSVVANVGISSSPAMKLLQGTSDAHGVDSQKLAAPSRVCPQGLACWACRV